MNLNYHLTPYRKCNSKQIKDLDVKLESSKYVKEDICRILHDIDFRSIFIDLTPLAKETKTNK